MNIKKMMVCALAGIGAYYLVSNYDEIKCTGKEMCKKAVKKIDEKMKEA